MRAGRRALRTLSGVPFTLKQLAFSLQGDRRFPLPTTTAAPLASGSAADPNSRWDGVSTVTATGIGPGEEITFDSNELGGTGHLGWSRWRGEQDAAAGAVPDRRM